MFKRDIRMPPSARTYGSQTGFWTRNTSADHDEYEYKLLRVVQRKCAYPRELITETSAPRSGVSSDIGCLCNFEDAGFPESSSLSHPRSQLFLLLDSNILIGKEDEPLLRNEGRQILDQFEAVSSFDS